MSRTQNHPKPNRSPKVPGRQHGQIRNGFRHHAPTRDLPQPAEPQTTSNPTPTQLSLSKKRHRPLGSALPQKGRAPFGCKAPTRDHPYLSAALPVNQSTHPSQAQLYPQFLWFPWFLPTLLPLSFILIPLSSFAQSRANAADPATAPGYSWGAETATGMYRPAAGAIGFAVGATERVRITTTGISTTNTVRLAAPAADNDIATKQYVDDTALAAGGGKMCGVPTYMGVTPSSYKGNLGGGTLVGVFRANALCAAAYPGSRMMASGDFEIADYTTTSMTVTGWVSCSLYRNGSAGVSCSGGGSSTNSCASGTRVWDVGTDAERGQTLTPTGLNESKCNLSLPLHCVKD